MRWEADFKYTLKHFADCRLVVEVHVKFKMTNAMKDAWDTTNPGQDLSEGEKRVKLMQEGVNKNWNNKFKLCCNNCIERCKDGVKIEVVLVESNFGHQVRIINDPNSGSTDGQWNLSQPAGLGTAAAHEAGHMLVNVEGYGDVSDIKGANDKIEEGQPQPQEGTNTEPNGIMGGGGNGATLNNFWNVLHNAGQVGLKGCSLKPVGQACGAN